MSTGIEGATIQVMVTVRATLSAGPVHLTLSARDGPAPGTWRYNLTDGPDHRAAGGRVAGMTDHMDVLRYAAGICSAGYEPGTIERGLLEQFAAGDMGDRRLDRHNASRAFDWPVLPMASRVTLDFQPQGTSSISSQAVVFPGVVDLQLVRQVDDWQVPRIRFRQVRH